ncbi:MAG: hypothetical protein OEY64_13380 [Nitrospinota bacterium]|nr:hypothetical protein [Nitrospinota bacterium]
MKTNAVKDYPLREIDRPLTMPSQLTDIGFSFLSGKNSSGAEDAWVGMFMNWHIGITDNIEMENLGLNYSGKLYENEYLIGAHALGVGMSSDRLVSAPLKAQFKLRHYVDRNFSLLMEIIERRIYEEGVNAAQSIRFSAGGIFQFTDNLALTVKAGYGGYLTDNRPDNANIATELNINNRHYFDITLFAGYSFIDEKERWDKKLFDENRRSMGGIRASMKF